MWQPVALIILYAAVVGAINWIKGWKFIPPALLAFLTCYFLGVYISIIIIAIFTKVRGTNALNYRGQVYMETKNGSSWRRK